MENTLKFYKQNDYFFTNEMLNNSLDCLSFFLTDEIAHEGSWWLDFLDNSSENTMIGNMLEVDKKGNKVFIGRQFRQDNEDRDPNAFETTIPELKRIIKEWVKLYNEQPNFIILKYENGKVSLKSE